MKRLLLLLAALVVVLMPAAQTRAADLNNFDPERIIDDAVFTNKDAMSINQIQVFLESKVPQCDTDGDKFYRGVRRRDYSSGNPAPFTCLKDYYQNTETGADNYGDKSRPDGSKSAARIIWEAGQNHDINPQVLLVTLYKENRLVVDDWPWKGQYKKAMGYGCPDTGPNYTANCNAEYFGFHNQMNLAAKQFRRYLNYPNNYNYGVGQRYVLYNPNPNCGGSTLNIRTGGTAALYNYTPYQPNQASLDNYPGTASCGAYGNRNFWVKFSEWFGNPSRKATYEWTVVSRSVYSDSDAETPLPLNLVVDPGQTLHVELTAKNTGNRTWSRSSLKLGTSGPKDRTSQFQTDGWLSRFRVTRMDQATVAPGEEATFEFNMIAPTETGVYDERFNLVAESITWLKDAGLRFEIEVKPSRDIAVFPSNRKTTKLNNNEIEVYEGAKLNASVKVRNNTGYTWDGSKTKLATTTPTDRSSLFSDSSWLSGGNRVSRLEGQTTLEPGESGRFDFTLTAPDSPGSYNEGFGLVIEGTRWIEYDTASLDIDVLEHPGNKLSKNDSLMKPSSIVSNNGQYKFVMQNDGNLVAYSPKRPIWASGTHGTNGNRLVMQNDGNLVIYNDSGRPVWASGTHGKY